MDKQCILCGKKQPVGLHIGGSFLCFGCEKALLRTDGYRLRRAKRKRLLRVYGA